MMPDTESLRGAIKRFTKNLYYGLNSVAGIAIAFVIALQAVGTGATVFAIAMAAIVYMALIGWGYAILDSLNSKKKRGGLDGRVEVRGPVGKSGCAPGSNHSRP